MNADGDTDEENGISLKAKGFWYEFVVVEGGNEQEGFFIRLIEDGETFEGFDGKFASLTPCDVCAEAEQSVMSGS